MELGQLTQILRQSAGAQQIPGGDRQQLRQRVLASPGLAAMLDDIRREGQRLLQSPAPELSYSLFRLYGETGSRQEYERAYFNRRKRLTAFGLLSWLEPDNADYLAALCDMLWSVCGEYTWCLTSHLGSGCELDERPDRSLGDAADGANRPWRDDVTIDLFAAETAFALSEMARLHGERLPALVRKRVDDAVLNRVLRPYARRDRPYHWECAAHNWAAVCAGSIGVAALYTLDDAGELSAVLDRLLPSMDAYLSGFAEDGACTEGYGYWQYGFGYYVYFADLLKERTGGALDLFRRDKVRAIAQFQQKTFLDGDFIVNFADSPVRGGIFMGLAHYLHRTVEGVAAPPPQLQAAYSADHCGRWAPALRNLIWFDDQIDAAPWEAASYYMKDAQWLVSRHITGSGRFAFAAKGGHNAEPHNHNDVGQFILHAGGTSLICDIGSGLYTRDYFGPGRYDILCNASFGHSLPIIDGACQMAGAAHRAAVLEASIAREADVFAIELAAAYAIHGMRSLVRTFRWRKTELPVLELEDRYAFDRMPQSIVERFITRVKPQLLAGIAELAAGEAAVAIRYDGAQLEPQIVELAHTDHHGHAETVYALDFHVRRPAADLTVSLTFEIGDRR